MAQGNPTAKLAQQDAKPEKGNGLLYVLDSTAVTGQGNRTHSQMVDGIETPYVFEPGKPLGIPAAIAIKFLKHEAFKLCDEKGTLLPFKRRPKQPDELEAGETLKLSDEECIARYDELSDRSLQARVLELPGGEKFATNPSRQAIIDFLVEKKAEARKINAAAPERGRDDFVPEADIDEEEAA